MLWVQDRKALGPRTETHTVAHGDFVDAGGGQWAVKKGLLKMTLERGVS